MHIFAIYFIVLYMVTLAFHIQFCIVGELALLKTDSMHAFYLLWSSVFVTLVAKKYRFMQFELDMVFDTR